MNGSEQPDAKPEDGKPGPARAGNAKPSPLAEADEVLEAGATIEVGNEFAYVRVRKVLTHNGERLELLAPKLGHRILLDPLELESISWQPHETFSKFLETPFGPH